MASKTQRGSKNTTQTGTARTKKGKEAVQPENAGSHSHDNRTRYSDPELREFQELILAKISGANAQIAYFTEQLEKMSENGNGRVRGLEDGTESSERETLNGFRSRQLKYVEDLKNALVRIENKTYGVCRQTGKLIPKERLRAVPHTSLSIEAKTGK